MTWIDVSPEQVHLEDVSDILDEKYGLGIIYNGGFLGHSGEILGYSNMMMHHPEKNTTIIVLFNNDDVTHTATRVFMSLAKMLFPDDYPE